MKQKTALVLGAGGFIGSHMVKRLKEEGYWVRGVDLKHPEFSKSDCDEFHIFDLRVKSAVEFSMKNKGGFDEVYQCAADMGGAEFIFTGEHDADLMPNSHLINIHVAEAAVTYNVKKLFYASSACIYPSHIQEHPDNPGLKESDAFPANPDSEYGFEKILSERLYLAYKRNYGLNVRIGRFHNIYGPEGTWEGIRAKAPAALCRKISLAKDGDEIEVFGDGEQTRSFLYIDQCIEGVRRLMNSEFSEPLNIGSDEIVSINTLANVIIAISKKSLTIKNVPSNALGVRGRNSDNTLIKETLNWSPNMWLYDGLELTYSWINAQANG
jgi:GDP-D-mannose 3',5'-epimerase